MIDKKKQGKANRAAGKRFEARVRDKLEKEGYIVFKNLNDVTKPVETEIGEFERFFRPSKPKFNPFTKSIMMSQGGFPDYIAIRRADIAKDKGGWWPRWYIQFVECKLGKYLDAEEKEKVDWIKKELKIPVFVAFPGKKRGVIEFKELEEEVFCHCGKTMNDIEQISGVCKECI